MFEKLQKQLNARKENNSFRTLKLADGLFDFCSNDYLGLSSINKASLSGFKAGSTGSRLLNGNYPLIEKLELELAQFHHSEVALVFNSGYAANVGLFSALPQKGDTVIYDELIHASIKDGVRLSFAKSYAFKHNDIEDLKRKISLSTGEVFVAVEAVYSMDGDSAPLNQLVQVCEELKCVLIVDEAHSVGVHGEKGEGLVVALDLEKRIPRRFATFSKAIGCHGAAVLSNNFIKDYLINFSRSFIYSTSLPPKSVASIRAAYDLLVQNNELDLLKSTIVNFNKLLQNYPGLKFIDSDSAIHCLVLGSNERAKSCSLFLLSHGFDVRPILSPTVAKGKERIRICLHSFNTTESIGVLLKSLNDFVLSNPL